MVIKFKTNQPTIVKPEKDKTPRNPQSASKTKHTTKPTINPKDTAEKRARGRPTSGNETISLRLPTEAIDRYRNTGIGWRARLQTDLQDFLNK